MSIAGKYELVSSDANYVEYLKAKGVPMIQRIVASSERVIIEWSKREEHGASNGVCNKWIQKTTTRSKKFEFSFTIGEEFDEKLANGRNVKSKIILESNKLIHQQREIPVSRKLPVSRHSAGFPGQDEDLGYIPPPQDRVGLISEVVREFNGDKMITKYEN